MPVADAPRRRHMHRLLKAGGIISAGLVLATQALSGGAFADGHSTVPPTSDYPARPEQTIGGGPFQLHAVSSDHGAQAAATAGLGDGQGSGASLVGSTASVKRTADGVVSDAAFRASVLAAGPVTLGRVT